MFENDSTTGGRKDTSSTEKSIMRAGGIGPKLALLCMPYIVLSLVVMNRYPEFCNLDFLDAPWIRALGWTGLGAGALLWTSSAVVFLKHFRSGRLITNGPFALCRNPIYSSIIIFIIPSLAILFHSGLVLSISVVLFLGFKLSIHGETTPLARTFGEEYEQYARSVNELLPIPRCRGKRSPAHRAGQAG